MSWSPDVFIGEFRPWPDTVQVVRGTYDDTRRYVPEEALVHMDLHECPACANVADLQDAMDENAKLRELVRELYHELDAATQYDAGGSRGIVSEFAGRMRKLGVDA